MTSAAWQCRATPLDRGGCCRLTWEERDTGWVVERVNLRIESMLCEVWLAPEDFDGDTLDLSWLPGVTV